MFARRLIALVGLALLSGLIPAFAADEPNDLIAKRFKELDKDGDGKLSKEELKSSPLIVTLLRGADKNDDGFITMEEARVQLKSRAAKKDDSQPAVATKLEVRRGPKILKPADVGVGRLVSEFKFKDIKGIDGKLSDVIQDRDVTVIAITNTSCPLCQKFAPTLAKLEKDYADKKVSFLFINPTPSEESAAILKQIETVGLKGRYVRDTDGSIIAALGATSTTEVFVLDSKRTLMYRGAIDDQYGQGYSLDAPRETYLKAAIDRHLAKRDIEIRATEAPGCALESKAVAKTTVQSTYHARISRIVNDACIECHRAEGLAPFALEKYEDLLAHKAMIRKVVEAGSMPPWFAAKNEGGITFRNDRSLSESDKKDLIDWLKSDMPKGDASDAPLKRSFPKDWAIGKPDLVFELPREVSVKATGFMNYQMLVVDTKLTEDKWIQAVEIQPTAKAVVHHVLAFVVAPGEDEEPERDDRGGFFAAYVPGNASVVYPDGMAKKLPKGSKLRFQMHYTPNGTATKDRTKLAVRFATEPPQYELKVMGLAQLRLRIPPGVDNHEESVQMPFPVDGKITALMPHMHLRGKSFKYEAIVGGKSQTLLDVPAYDFNWQLSYRLAEPLALNRGTMLKATAHYDNSDKNPANPDPKALVKWGPQTTNEMMLGYVEFYVPRK